MTDRSAFVTSAADGIGRATVPPLVEAGFAVVAVDIDRDGLDGTLDLVREAGGSCDVAIADVSDADAVRFDGSFNDAGLLGAAGPITAYDEDFPDRVVAANQRGTILGLKYVLRDMVRQGSDLVVNTATVGAHGALIDIATHRGARHRGVRVNALLPGNIRTKNAAGGTTGEESESATRRPWRSSCGAESASLPDRRARPVPARR